MGLDIHELSCKRPPNEAARMIPSGTSRAVRWSYEPPEWFERSHAVNSAEALRSIRYDWLHYIQQRVRAEFDNALQTPLHFKHGVVHRSVREVLGRF